MKYSDGVYEVEMFDRVEFRNPLTGSTFDGVVTAICPRAKRLRLKIEDWLNTTRSGDPVRRSVECSIDDVDLIQRDG